MTWISGLVSFIRVMSCTQRAKQFVYPRNSLYSVHSRNELYLVADNSVAQFVYPPNSLYLVQDKSWTPVLPEMGAIHRISIYQFDNLAHFLQGLYIIRDFVRNEH